MVLPEFGARGAQTKRRENNFSVTQKYYVIVPYSNRGAVVLSPNWFLLDRKVHVESNVRVCAALK